MITGATTAIGRALVEELLDDAGTERVIAVGAEPTRGVESDGRVVRLRVDLRRERSIRELVFGPVREHGITTVIDMATHRAASALGSYALNVEETRRLMHFVERVDSVERFVYRSFGDVYRARSDLPAIIDEDHPLRIGPGVPQYVLDRVEADLAVCARMGMSRIGIVVLRMAECLAPEAGSQLWDYLQSRVCMRPLGFDPMINLMSAEDAGAALALAAKSRAQGIFNIPGFDTLPLSRILERFGRTEVAVPSPLMRPAYALRRATLGADFHWSLAEDRLRYGFVLDGQRASEVLGYAPRHPVHWPLSLERVGRRAERRNPRALRGAIESILRSRGGV